MHVLALQWLVALALAQGPTQTAAEHFERGVALSDRGEYAASLQEFQEAYRLSPTFHVLFNVARLHEKLSEPVEALQAYQRYLSEGGREIGASRRREVGQAMNALRKQVAELVIEIRGDPAQLEVDGFARGITPLREPLYVVPGAHHIVARRGAESALSDVEVHRGQRAQVQLAWVAAEVPEAPAPHDVPSLPPSAEVPLNPRLTSTFATEPVPLPRATTSLMTPMSGREPAGQRRWLFGGAALAAGIGAAVLGGVALVNANDLQQHVHSPAGLGYSYTDLAPSTVSRRTFQINVEIVSTVGLLVAGAGLGSWALFREGPAQP